MTVSTAAVMLVKDEADIVEVTVRHLLTQVDQVFVADNLSTDGTHAILRRLEGEHRDRLFVSVDDEPGYYQARKTTALAQHALLRGHDWVVPCDADELWYSAFGRLADVIEQHDRAGFDVVTAEMYDHVPTSQDVGDNPVARMRWRRTERGALPKVACRLTPDLEIEMGNHAANYAGEPGRTREWGVTIRHFPYRSPEQFVSKAVNGAAAYAAAADVPEEYGGHWRGYGAMIAEHGPQAGYDWFHAWFYSDDPPRPPVAARDDPDAVPLIRDPAPVGGYATPVE